MSSLAIVLMIVFTGPATARDSACVAEDLCESSADPCLISTDFDLEDGCLFDFGSRDVVLERGVLLHPDDGSVSLRAGSLTIERYAGFEGREAGESGGLLTIELEGDLVSEGNIRLQGQPSGGSLQIETGGSITLSKGSVSAGGPVRSANGGQIGFKAEGDIFIGAPLDALGARRGLDVAQD